MTASAALNQRKLLRSKRGAKLTLYLMLVPAFLYLIANNFLPMLGITIAFKQIDWQKGIFQSDWCGFKNFEFLFKTKDAYIMIRNTLAYNAVWIISGTIIAVTIAIFMSEIGHTRAAKWIQPAICFPFMLSMVVISYLVYAFISSPTGLLNNTIFKDSPISWYQEAKYWPIILTIVRIWQTSGQNSIVYMASISGIDKSLYEAARVDGAGKLQQIWYITLPTIRPTIILMLLLQIGRIFNSDFGLFYQVPMNSGMLYSTTQTIDTYVYRALLEMNNIGMSSAASVFQAILGFLVVILSNWVIRRIDKESALF